MDKPEGHYARKISRTWRSRYCIISPVYGIWKKKNTIEKKKRKKMKMKKEEEKEEEEKEEEKELIISESRIMIARGWVGEKVMGSYDLMDTKFSFARGKVFQRWIMVKVAKQYGCN